MKKKYKIVFDRPHCIGPFACAEVYPERWKVGNDSKAILVNGKQEGEQFILEIELTPEELERDLEAARVCPVNVIRIYDEEGNEIA